MGWIGDGVVSWFREIPEDGFVLDFWEDAVLGETVWEKFLSGVLKEELLLVLVVVCLARLEGGGVPDVDGGGE